MAQYGRPSTDTTRESWEDQAAGTATIYTTIDEVTASTADYIRSAQVPTTDAAVTNSEISTTATTFQRLRSASSISFTNALSYRAQFGKAGADAGEFLGARIIMIPV